MHEDLSFFLAFLLSFFLSFLFLFRKPGSISDSLEFYSQGSRLGLHSFLDVIFQNRSMLGMNFES